MVISAGSPTRLTSELALSLAHRYGMGQAPLASNSGCSEPNLHAGGSTGSLKLAHAGIASAVVNMSQQVGGSVGTAALSTVFAGALTGYLSSHPAAPGLRTAATVHGDTIAFYSAAGFFAVGLPVAAFVLPGRDRARDLVDAEPQPLAPGPVAGATVQAAQTS